MDKEEIVIKGARENNLKNVDLTIPKNALVVFTGVSGSGKSTLAFDTIFAEGQRRYVESLSSYARQFLGSYEKPDVDSIDGLTPTISIDQKTKSHNPRSTVGTVTEIYDYLRLLFGRIGEAYCPHHHIKIEALTSQQITDLIMDHAEGAHIEVMAPLARNEKGTFADDIAKFLKAGFNRMKIDGADEQRYQTVPLLDKNAKHTIYIVIDRIVLKPDSKERVLEAVKSALDIGNGYVNVSVDGEEKLYSEHHSCPVCGFSFPEIEPRLFSFNNPLGCCPDCKGLGEIISADPDLLVPNPDLSISEGALRFYSVNKQEVETMDWLDLQHICEAYKIPLDKPFRSLTKTQKDIVFYGPKEPVHYTVRTRNGSTLNKTASEGALSKLNRLYQNTTSSWMKEYYGTFMSSRECPTCHGARLNEKVLAIYVDGKNIDEVCRMPLNECLQWFKNIHLTETQHSIADMVVTEIRNRLQFLCDVGLDYLTLSREAMTLSGGESQRIRLATQIGSKLSGIVYVLDEPSIGLHQRDNDRLIKTMKEMRDLGNTLIVVEHDTDTMKAADFLVDVGPGAGDHGGEIMYAGKPEGIVNVPDSITGQYLSGKKSIPVPSFRRPGVHKLVIRGAKCHNLKNIDVTFKTGALNLVTGVSGSGKSSLVNEILYKALKRQLNNSKDVPGEYSRIDGLKYFDKVINVDQDPIGATPRSNPATYINVFDDIRAVFAETREAKLKGFTKSSFSFNTKGGRCEACQGNGVTKISMAFMPDVYVTCPVCHGKRYTDEILSCLYHGKSIYDVLNMRAEEAVEFFSSVPSIRKKLQTLVDVGLGYIRIGQGSPTLSGGESQRVKLAYELEKASTGDTLYILDEPTTGLHIDDISRLVKVLDRFVEQGNTVIVIEHNLDFIKCADWIVDLGPEGGDRGGNIIVEGTPEQVAACDASYTGQYLRRYLPSFQK